MVELQQNKGETSRLTFSPGSWARADTQASGQGALPSGQTSLTQGVRSNSWGCSWCKLQHEAKPAELGEISPHPHFLYFPGGTKEFFWTLEPEGKTLDS